MSANEREPHTVRVETPSRSYDVFVGLGILHEVGHLVREAAGGSAAVVVSDSNVGPLYADDVLESLGQAGYDASLVTFPAGERHKRLSTFEGILEGIAARGLSRDDVVVALGGGVTGDMAGYAAASYLRGIQFVQVPTSLLAMVDSSVGGKCAVDLSCGKNLAGTFHQPSLVVADVTCLSTLSPELFRDSCGEVIKHAILSDRVLFDELCSHPLTDPTRTVEEVARIVARNVEIKRDVVNADERERGLRQTLNLGHTIGHAIEAASDYTLGHGSSVAAGLCCMLRATEALGWSSLELTRRTCDCVSKHGLPTDTLVDHKTLFEFATHDKKRHGGSVNVVVARDINEVEVRRITLDELRTLIDLGCGTGA